MSRLRPDMRLTRTHPHGGRAQTVTMDCSFMPAASWPADLMDQVAALLAAALVKDIREHPMDEWPVGQLPS